MISINNLEQRINYQLNKYPKVKRFSKRVYQRLMCIISRKPKCQGDIIRVSPSDGFEYFFGYYDKSPWDITGRFMLCLKAKNTWSVPDCTDEADVILIDTEKDNESHVIARTHTWNVQQGCMLQWLGPDFSSKIIYNDIRGGNYCSIILDVYTREERVVKMPVYSVSRNGKFALTLDFSRLHSLRPGYGYANVPESTKGEPLPNATAVWRVDLSSGEVVNLLKYSDFAHFQPREDMIIPGTIHKVNHIMISPNGDRFMVLYRWFNGLRKYTRLITCNLDGTDMYLLSDDDMVSHCCWRNNEEILAYENKKKEGCGYYLMKDKSREYKCLWPSLTCDGHPSYSPVDDHTIITDSYPDRYRVSTIRLLRDDTAELKVIAKVYNPFKYDNETRCDLHPRWSRDGQKICFDACFEGYRGLYVVNLK